MKRPLYRLFVPTLVASLLFVGCSSQEAPPTAREEAESARERAEDQAEVAHKYALWTTPQLIREREDLGRKINGEGVVVAPVAVIGIVALARNAEQKKFNELTGEIARRQGLGQPTSVAAVTSPTTGTVARTGRRTSYEDPYEKWMRENGRGQR